MGLVLKNKHTLSSLAKLLKATPDYLTWAFGYEAIHKTEVSYDLDSEMFCVWSSMSDNSLYYTYSVCVSAG